MKKPQKKFELADLGFLLVIATIIFVAYAVFNTTTPTGSTVVQPREIITNIPSAQPVAPLPKLEEKQETYVEPIVQDKIKDEKTIEVVVLLDKKEDEGRILSNLDSSTKLKHKYKSLNAVSLKVSKEGLKRLKEQNVKAILDNREFSIALDNSIPLIEADKVHNLSIQNINLDGSGETVCIIDTGIYYNLTDLKNNYIGGYDFINDDNDPLDDQGHGTHVAGIIAANGKLKGVAPGAKIVAVKALDENGRGTFSSILAGIDFCISNSTQYNISIISMSLGDSGKYNNTSCPNYFTSNFEEAHNKNITLVACLSKAIAPDTCGVAIEVPPM